MTLPYEFVGARLHERCERVSLDTVPFYIGVRLLSKYLRIDPLREHRGWDDTVDGES